MCVCVRVCMWGMFVCVCVCVCVGGGGGGGRLGVGVLLCVCTCARLCVRGIVYVCASVRVPVSVHRPARACSCNNDFLYL